MSEREVPEKWQKLYQKCLSGKASPRQCIKMFCGECMGYDRTEVAACEDEGCPLYSKRPKFKSAALQNLCNSPTEEENNP
jgi:hypothetical protein